MNEKGINLTVSETAPRGPKCWETHRAILKRLDVTRVE